MAEVCSAEIGDSSESIGAHQERARPISQSNTFTQDGEFLSNVDTKKYEAKGFTQESHPKESVDNNTPGQTAPLFKTERIKVLVRVRPVTFAESSRGAKSIVACNQSGYQNTVYIDGSLGGKNVKCRYDSVIGPEARQETIYQSVSDCTEAFLEGFNATVFAYGQTGSGKTHTMFGPPGYHFNIGDNENAGVIPRVIHDIFEAIKFRKYGGFKVYCSFVQIYNENLYDMLRDANRACPLVIHEDSNREIYVEGLSEFTVRNAQDCMALLRIGEDNRAIRETQMNQLSSRSHSLFQLVLEQTRIVPTGEKLLKSKFNLVDLAGSEKWGSQYIEGEHVNELNNINLSLFTLGKCISALSQKTLSHVPFRESKLTRLLQDSLGGNTKTRLIATLSPVNDCIDESISTLKFADRAKQVMIYMRKNVQNATGDDNNVLVTRLQQEIIFLKNSVKQMTLKLDETNKVKGSADANKPNSSDADSMALQKEKEGLYSKLQSTKKVNTQLTERLEKLEKEMYHEKETIVKLLQENAELRKQVNRLILNSTSKKAPKATVLPLIPNNNSSNSTNGDPNNSPERPPRAYLGAANPDDKMSNGGDADDVDLQNSNCNINKTNSSNGGGDNSVKVTEIDAYLNNHLDKYASRIRENVDEITLRAINSNKNQISSLKNQLNAIQTQNSRLVKTLENVKSATNKFFQFEIEEDDLRKVLDNSFNIGMIVEKIKASEGGNGGGVRPTGAGDTQQTQEIQYDTDNCNILAEERKSLLAPPKPHGPLDFSTYAQSFGYKSPVKKHKLPGSGFDGVGSPNQVNNQSTPSNTINKGHPPHRNSPGKVMPSPNALRDMASLGGVSFRIRGKEVQEKSLFIPTEEEEEKKILKELKDVKKRMKKNLKLQEWLTKKEERELQALKRTEAEREAEAVEMRKRDHKFRQRHKRQKKKIEDYYKKLKASADADNIEAQENNYDYETAFGAYDTNRPTTEESMEEGDDALGKLRSGHTPKNPNIQYEQEEEGYTSSKKGSLSKGEYAEESGEGSPINHDGSNHVTFGSPHSEQDQDE